MKIIDEKVYRGKNIYSYKVCMRFTVDLEDMCDVETKDIKGFNERLLKALPGLKKHKCALGYEGGFVERLNEGTYLPHVLEHSIIEMQNHLGFMNVKYGKARQVEGPIYYIVFQYEDENAGLLCGYTALECINNFIENRDYDMQAALERIEKEIGKTRLGVSTKAIYDEAVKRGIPVLKIGDQSTLQLGYGKYQRRIGATITDKTPCLAVDISCDKSMTKEVLMDAALPVPEGIIADSLEEVFDGCRKIGYPVVIKPLNGNQGRGVTTEIMDDDAAEIAYREASKIDDSVIVERFIEGRDYRVLVINNKVAAVSLRMPPSVVGDGVHTISELIEIENKNPLRGYGHEKPMTKVIIDDVMIEFLKHKGNKLSDIPPEGEVLPLRNNANLSTGGMAKDCTDIIHPDNMEYALRAAKSVGLDIAGIDICTKDISKSMKTDGGAIIEVNAAPGIRMHIHPSLGKARNVAKNIVDYLFPEDTPSSVPVVSITGSNGKTTTTKMIGHILTLNGKAVGMTTTTGVYINNKCVIKGDTTGPDSARTVLTNREIDVAVLETARGGILRRGLGYDMADVGVITNISDDHLGLDDINTIEELAYVKSLVAEAVKDDGYAVLNADDEFVHFLTERVESNIIYFSKSSDNLIVRKHILDAGKAVILKNDTICITDGENITPIVSVNEIPSTLDGKIECNIENAMAAAAACIGMNIEIEVIARGLKTFYLDDTQNPGRFNVYNMDNFKVVVDYGHNTSAFRAVSQGLRRFNSNRYVGIIGVPGDRRDDIITAAGKAGGEGFDYIYIKEDIDKRGRKNGEVAKLLEEGVLQAGRNKSDYEIVLNEVEALKIAMNNAQNGDCIVVFYEFYQPILDAIEEFKNSKGLSRVESNIG